MAGYSGTPLIKKLGIKPDFDVAFVNAPAGFIKQLDLPREVRVNSRSRKGLDSVLLFVRTEKELKQNFKTFAARLKPAGMLWVAWPKKSSGVSTDLTFTNVQAIGLTGGLVDVKICAIDEIWSGLKFVYRLQDRR
jgi:hypothetical protein